MSQTSPQTSTQTSPKTSQESNEKQTEKPKEEQNQEEPKKSRPRNIMKTRKTTYNKRPLPKKVKGTVVKDKRGKPIMLPSRVAYEIHHYCDDENSDVSEYYRKLLFRVVLGHNGSNVEGLYRLARNHFGRNLNVWKQSPDIFIIDKEGKDLSLRESHCSHVVIISSLDKDLTTYLSQQVVKDIKYIKSGGKSQPSRPRRVVTCPGRFISQLVDIIPKILEKERNPNKISLHYERMFDEEIPVKKPTQKPKQNQEESKEKENQEESKEEEPEKNIIGTFVISGDDQSAVMRTKLNVEHTITSLKEEEEKRERKERMKKNRKYESDSDTDSSSSDYSSDSDSDSDDSY